MITMKKQLLVLLAVGVFSHSATGKRDKCRHERQEYNVGDVVLFLPNDCIKLVCRPNNVIEQEKPLGPHSRKCCVCHNKLYGSLSQTCKSFKTTGICPVPCKTNGKEWAHGDVLETNLAQCSRRRCLNGKITMEQPLGNGLTGCCLTKKKMAAPGTVISNGGCVPETCGNSIWIPSSTTIINTCAKCSIFNDPHFNDFSGAIFDWHVGCNHALVQEGNSMNPEFGVFMDFNRIGHVGYIGGPTTYQEDRNTQVVLHPGNTQITVNGHSQQITTTNPTFLVGPGGTKTTAMAWKHGACIRLYGKPRILVELCGHAITIWAAPWVIGQKPLAGLCGSTNKFALQERKLVDRLGNKHPSPGGYRVAAAAFGYNWQAADQTKAGCPATGAVGRRRMLEQLLDARETQAEKERKVCEDVSQSRYMPQCLEVVKDAGLTGADRDMLLNACLFDCCVIANDKEAGITVKDMLQQHQEIAAETKDQEDNTIEFVSAETKCPAEWSPVGRQCFQVHRFSESISTDDARQNCMNQEATLAQPRDIKATNNFLQSALSTLPRNDTGCNSECKFPFIYKGVTYNQCTDAKHDRGWCSTITDDQNNYIRGKWINCKECKGVAKEWLIDGGLICRKPEGINICEGYICEREPLACGDEDDDCAWRAADGECNGNKPYMFNFCKASCKVPCDCDQPDTCTEVGGMCQPLKANCAAISDPTLCSGDNCTCCYVPDPCRDAQDQDCESFVEEGYCEAKEEYILEEMRKYCSLSCGFCEPMN